MNYTEIESNIFNVYKPAGYTPLQCLDVLRENLRLDNGISMTYAGRLDPMAEGLLLVLIGEAVHRKDEYIKLDKWYAVTAVLGVETDSGDLLGLVDRTYHSYPKLDPSSPSFAKASAGLRETGMTRQVIPHLTSPILGEEPVKNLLQSYTGEITLPLPLYSSPLVSRKPLFVHAQNNTLDKTDVPTRISNIYECELEKVSSINSVELLSYLQTTIPNVRGEFRQTATLQAWQSLLKDNFKLSTITFSVHCSSGTYIRSLVEKLGKDLDTPACVYKLIRTQIGMYTI